MNKLRDLKADLEIVQRAKEFEQIMSWGSEEFITLASYFKNFHENGIDIAKHAIERAIKAETLVRELVAVLRDANGYIQHHIEHGHIPSPKGDNPLLLHTPGNIRSVLTKAREVLGDE